MIFNFNRLGSIYRSTGEYAKAINIYNMCIKFIKKIDNKVLEIETSTNLGNVYIDKGDFNKAKKIQQSALKQSIKFELKKQTALLYNNLSYIFRILSETDIALDYIKKSISINTELNSIQNLQLNYNSLGEILKVQGKDEEAKEMFQMSLEINQQIGSKIGIVKNYLHIADLLNKGGSFGEALSLMDKCITICREEKYEKETGYVLLQIAIGYSGINQLDKSLENYNQSLLIFRKFGNKLEIALCLNNLSHIEIINGNIEIAQEYLDESMSINKELGLSEALKLNAQNQDEIKRIQASKK